MELGSVDQAKDLVKFHVNYPPTVNGEQMEFSISTTFNFLQVEEESIWSLGPPHDPIKLYFIGHKPLTQR